MKAMNGVTTLKAHVALNVGNVEKSIEFYRALLGIEPSKVRTGYAKFDVANPPLNLTLNQVQFGERGALSHLGIQVTSTDDVLAIGQAWREMGLYTKDEMGTNCCYAVQNKTWAKDPDGNEWEVFVVLEDNLAESTTCCVPDAERNLCATDVAEPASVAAETTTEPAAAVAELELAVACCEPGCCS